MVRVSGKEERERFLLEIQDKGFSPAIALLSSARAEVAETRTGRLTGDDNNDNKVFEQCLSIVCLRLGGAIEKLTELQKKIAEEII